MIRQCLQREAPEGHIHYHALCQASIICQREDGGPHGPFLSPTLDLTHEVDPHLEEGPDLIPGPGASLGQEVDVCLDPDPGQFLNPGQIPGPGTDPGRCLKRGVHPKKGKRGLPIPMVKAVRQKRSQKSKSLLGTDCQQFQHLKVCQ